MIRANSTTLARVISQPKAIARTPLIIQPDPVKPVIFERKPVADFIPVVKPPESVTVKPVDVAVNVPAVQLKSEPMLTQTEIKQRIKDNLGTSVFKIFSDSVKELGPTATKEEKIELAANFGLKPTSNTQMFKELVGEASNFVGSLGIPGVSNTANAIAKKTGPLSFSEEQPSNLVGALSATQNSSPQPMPAWLIPVAIVAALILFGGKSIRKMIGL